MFAGMQSLRGKIRMTVVTRYNSYSVDLWVFDQR